ncbi:MAG: hypothetical protein N2578_05465, partial [Bdellovibrionaceae bacterium]|nr:hypothetical protein [Pseudobdellovibrionaceae bacterium]
MRWRLSIEGDNRASLFHRSTTAGLKMDAILNFPISSHLQVDVAPAISLRSGSHQSFDGSSGPKNSILLNEAAVGWGPLSWLHIRAGALNQRALHSGLVVGARPFPALRGESLFYLQDLEFRLRAEKAVPSSESLSSNTSQMEETPSLEAAVLEINWKSSPRRTWMNRIGVYQFNNLPTAVATESSLKGNTVDSLSETESAFRYKFYGLEGASHLRWPAISQLDLLLFVEAARNQAAPAGLNTA